LTDWLSAQVVLANSVSLTNIGENLSDENREHKRHPGAAQPFIYEDEETVTLYFEMGSVQSQMKVGRPNLLMLDYTRSMMGFLLVNNLPRHIGTIGLGGGSIQKHCYRTIPQSLISVAEISSEVIALRDHFFIPKDDSRFTVFCEDGANFVARHSNEFDVLIVDGFDITGQPEQLCSQRFYDDCYEALTPNGVMAVNMPDHNFRGLLARMRLSFRNLVVVVGCEDGDNQIAFAAKGSALPQWDRGLKHLPRIRQYHRINSNKAAFSF
jgi:spermidine synthase